MREMDEQCTYKSTAHRLYDVVAENWDGRRDGIYTNQPLP